MKQKSRGYMLALGAVLFGVATTMAYDAGTAYTVPAGTTVTVTDADIDSFNALASVSFGDAAATLVFNTSKAPTVPISGSGTIRKISADAWTLDTAQSGFTGTWDFTDGETSLTVRYALGDEASASNIYVMTNYWYIWIPAGILIVLTVLGFNFVGDGLRDAFDPRMKR